MKQVFPRFLNPTKFFNASFFTIFGVTTDDGDCDLMISPVVVTLRDFLIAGWLFSTPLTPSTEGERLLIGFLTRKELLLVDDIDDDSSSSSPGFWSDDDFLEFVVELDFIEFLSSTNAVLNRSNFESGESLITKSSQA